ncbi:unnamed protein product [Ambrosiozyma monospora]|uniref:Unnamed protein product n=1 Tax=Ambrosiozyma monospora TaxID=43982 RepID=A0ACB5TMQ9_AMBMO|nr:unnamed protein product [Ambrosiozyma monospora]
MLNILKYNDNMNNDFTDCFYVAHLIRCLVQLLINTNRFIENHNLSITDDNGSFVASGDVTDQFVKDVVLELNRCLQMDQWSPSVDGIVTTTVIIEKIKLARAGLIDISFSELVAMTKPNNYPQVRVAAFEGLLAMGGLKNSNILSLFFLNLKLDPSQHLKYCLLLAFMRAIGTAAIDGTPSKLDDDEFVKLAESNGGVGSSGNGSVKRNESQMVGDTMIIVQDHAGSGAMQNRRDQIARSTLKGAIEVFRRDYSIGKGLRWELWQALHSCLLSINTKRNLFDTVTVLFQAIDTLKVVLDLPLDKKIVAKVEQKKVEVDQATGTSVGGTFVISLKREGRLKVKLPVLKTKSTPSASGTSTPVASGSAANPITLPSVGLKKGPTLKLKPIEPSAAMPAPTITSPTSIRIKVLRLPPYHQLLKNCLNPQ